ncbi:MAG: cytochrome-c oxidase, cbb3-type subunit II, partial [Vicinamibacterales bacterium]|nr:cytochrome-c oxidase, cbb3-type subunit II [Vicinamibacterales bacterium]
VTYYGMSTFEGPMMSIKSVNAVSHFTDWTIGHVHAGALGWNAFLSFGILYWVVPRLWKTELYSNKLATAHFWVSTIGLITYQVSMWVAGITQWGMWRAFEPDGRLVYPDFIETVIRIVPLYWVRLIAALLFFSGLLLLVWNVYKTIKSAPADYAVEPEVKAPPLVRDLSAPGAVTAANTYDHAFYRLEHEIRHGVHRALEARTVTFTVLTALALAVGSLVEAIPMFFDRSNVPEIASVKPYTPLEVVGRDIYIREGCYNCHSQLVRPFRYETERYGEFSKAGEYVYDHPFQWGSKRTGPDLHRVGAKYPSLWHVRHMDRPDSTTPGSVMPRYPHLLTDAFDTTQVAAKLGALRTLGVPYTDGEIETARASMETQARAIATEVESQQGPTGLADKEIVALTAYLQRLGTDIKWRRPQPQPQPPVFTPAVTTPAAPAAAPVAAAPARGGPAVTQPSSTPPAAAPVAAGAGAAR